MDVDEVLERIGGWGRYQKVVYLLAALPSIASGIVTMAYSWTAFFMEHRYSRLSTATGWCPGTNCLKTYDTCVLRHKKTISMDTTLISE